MGLRTLDSTAFSTIHVEIIVWDAQGNAVQTFERDYPDNSFWQMPVTEFLDGLEIGENYSFTFGTSGPIIVYGATVDNVTNSPTIQSMPYVEIGG